MSWLLIAALLYPAVVKTEANLFKEDAWRNRIDTMGEFPVGWEKSKGGPFSSEEPVWKLYSRKPMSVFWSQNVKVEKGRRYLVGAWVRRRMARALVWCYGRTKDDKPFDQRMYLFGGFNSCLDNYLRPEIKRKLGGDSDAWQLLYRPVEIDKDIAGSLQFKFGIFMSTGELDIAHPFLVDITGMELIPHMVEVSGGKRISRLAVELAGLRDLAWEKKFPEPADGFSGLIGDADALRGFNGANRIDGCMLSVKYADGSVENVYAPQEGAFLHR